MPRRCCTTAAAILAAIVTLALLSTITGSGTSMAQVSPSPTPMPFGRFRLNAVASRASLADDGVAWVFDALKG